jgi:hypothetical protein
MIGTQKVEAFEPKNIMIFGSIVLRNGDCNKTGER